MKLVNRNAKANLILSSLVFCLVIVFFYSCGSGSDGSGGSSGTGSIAFKLAIQGDQQVENYISRQTEEDIIDCGAYGINTIEVEVSDENNEFLAKGGPWDCEDHKGTTPSVKAGNNRKLDAFAKDIQGIILYSQEVTGITVLPGQTTELGTIVLVDNSRPVADAGPDQTAFIGDTVTLDASGSFDLDGDPLTFLWSLITVPGGSSASLSDPTEVNPTFFMDQRGTYVAQLIVNDGIVDSDPDTVTIDWINSCPVANAGPDQTGFTGDTVKLDGGKSTDRDGDTITYFWTLFDVPKGSSASLSDPTAVNPTFFMDQPGDYKAKLIVNDGTCDSAPDTVTINWINTCPVANAGPNQTIKKSGDTVTLDGSKSTDVDGDKITYFWALTSRPKGSSALLSDPTAAKPTFIADKVGTYLAQLTVNDGSCDSEKPDTVKISVDNTCPVANAGPNQTIKKSGDTVTLDGSKSTDVDGDKITYFWALTSRPKGSSALLSDPTAAKPTFVADKVGKYVAQLIVNDGTCDSAPDTVTINAANSCPVANAGPNQTGKKAGDTVTLDGGKSSDWDKDTITYLWALINVPKGSSALLSDPTATKPTFIADKVGTYVAQLIVNDGICDSAPDTVTIIVENTCPVANAGPDQTVYYMEESVELDGSGSTDADGHILTYSWVLINCYPPSHYSCSAYLEDPTLEKPTLHLDVYYRCYEVQLKVNDGICDSDPDTVIVCKDG